MIAQLRTLLHMLGLMIVAQGIAAAQTSSWNSSSVSGTTTVNASTFELTSSASNNFGALPNSTIAISSGATLAIDSVGATVIPSSVIRAKSVVLNGGTLTVATETGTTVSPDSSNDIITGPLTFNSGYGTVTVTGTASANNATLTVGSLASNGGGALVNGVNLGRAAPASNLNGSSLMLASGTPTVAGTQTFSGAGSGNITSLAIVPYLAGEVSTTSGGAGTAGGIANTFLTYDTTSGLRPLDLTNEYNTIANVNLGTATNNNIKVTASGTLIASSSINSLLMTGGTLSITNGTALTIGSGAILSTSSATIASTSGATGTLAFGAVPAYIDVNSGTTLAISALVTGSGGIDKIGNGSLTLSGTSNTYTGNISLESGTLTLNGADAANNAGITSVLAGTLVIGNANALGTSNTTSVLLGNTNGNAAAGITLATSSNFTRNIILQSGGTGATSQTTAGSAYDLNGNSQTLTGITDNATAPGSALIINTGAASTLTVNGSTNSTFHGALENGASTLSLVKNGTGTFTLAGTSSMSGTVTVHGGALVATGTSNVGITSQTGTLVGTFNITVASSAGLFVGEKVSGTGIAANSYITAISATGTTVTLSGSTTGSTATPLTPTVTFGLGGNLGTGAIVLNGGTLSIAPTLVSSSTNINLASANGATGTQFVIGGGGDLALNKNGNNSLTYSVGGGGTPLNRVNNGTLVITPTSGIASLGTVTGENFVINGTTPTVTNGMAASYFVGQASATDSSGDFLTYGNGFTGFGSAASNYTSASGCRLHARQ